MSRSIGSRSFARSAFVCAFLLPALVAAQPTPAPPPAEPVPPAPVPVEPPAPGPTPPSPVTPGPLTPPSSTTPHDEPPAPAAPSTSTPAAPAIDVLPPTHAREPLEAPTPLAEPALHGTGPELESLPWYDAIEFRAFVDGYLGLNWQQPKPSGGANNVTRAYDNSNGFALSWAGVDATYPAEPVGGTISLRFGPTAERIAGSCISGTCDSSIGLSFLKQAYASFRPWNPIQLDFGKFDTIYGVEVAESQDNMNYTRGAVYWFTQPLFHTGLRVNAELTDNLTLRAMIVNGWNNTIDNNLGKDLGLQLALTLPRSSDGGNLLATSLGYLGGPEQDDSATIQCNPASQYFDPSSPTGCSPGMGGATSGKVDRGSSNTKGLRHLIDFVATLTPTDKLTVQLNADLDIERVRDTIDTSRFIQHEWWGVMLGARYAFVDKFAVAVRGEYLADPDAYGTGIAKLYAPTDPNVEPPTDIKLLTATLTLDYRPADFLILRLDNRADWSNKEIFPRSVRDMSGVMPTTTLGVVVTTN